MTTHLSSPAPDCCVPLHRIDDDGRCSCELRVSDDSGVESVLVNPEIIEHGKRKGSMDEGCLSFPGLYANVTVRTRLVHAYAQMSCLLLFTFIPDDY